eukprot:4549375-Karenia_brevis.AAC.1
MWDIVLITNGCSPSPYSQEFASGSADKSALVFLCSYVVRCITCGCVGGACCGGPGGVGDAV